ncbi:hypothetical protein, partial [Leptospira interrogans]|uniref:hypothetical protein n=1 Tax=Leptospira interrogans TaxID=173 RepID=UPI001D1527BE
ALITGAGTVFAHTARICQEFQSSCEPRTSSKRHVNTFSRPDLTPQPKLECQTIDFGSIHFWIFPSISIYLCHEHVISFL